METGVLVTFIVAISIICITFFAIVIHIFRCGKKFERRGTTDFAFKRYRN